MNATQEKGHLQFAQRFVSISFPDITVVGAESCRKSEDMTQTYRDFVKEIYTEMPRNRGNLITDLSPLASRRVIRLDGILLKSMELSNYLPITSTHPLP